LEEIHVKPSLKLAPTSSLAAQATQRIRDAITDGEFALGEMIPEEGLAQAMGISRTPVREALNQLQRVGLVVIRPQRGSYVFEPSEDDIRDICDYRYMLERQAARLSRAHRLDDTLRAMSDAVTRMEAARRDGRRVAYGQADTRFHEALFEGCGNPYLRGAYDLVAGKIAALRTQLTAPFEALQTQSFDEHRDFVELFRQGDFDQFDTLMREHIDRTGIVYSQAWKALQKSSAEQAERRL
jgi:DNA-binding GntR family transcriptional regulator